MKKSKKISYKSFKINKLLPTLLVIFGIIACGILLQTSQDLRKNAAQSAVYEEDVSHITPDNSTTSVVRIELTDYPLAVSNDGSPAMYYYRPGTGSGSDKWIIYLPGGGSCVTAQQCEERMRTKPFLMSTNNAPEAIHFTGILNNDPSVNPAFHNYNQVLVLYTTSDNWYGNIGASQETAGYHFRGKQVIISVVDSLKDLGLEEASNVVLAGTSAGGAGVKQNLDFVADRLPSADVKGIVDSHWYPRAFFNDEFRNEDEFQGTVINKRAELDATCARDAHDETIPKETLCMSSLITSYLKNPIFVIADLNDPIAMQIPRRRDRLNFGKELVLNSLENTDGFFAPDRGIHGYLTTTSFSSIKIGDISLPEALDLWMQGETLKLHD